MILPTAGGPFDVTAEIRAVKIGRRGLTVLYDADYEVLLSRYSWHLSGASYTGAPEKKYYAATTTQLGVLLMHRIVMAATPGQQVDHINGNGLDNRRANLRFCSHSENLANRGPNINNRSGFKGVHFDKRCTLRPWMATVRRNGLVYRAGWFATPEDAHRAYLSKAQELFGEFARGDK